GTMALSGVPLFFAGAWTKEEILHATAGWPSSRIPYYLTMAGVILTALYMTRQVIYVFFGQRRAAAEHAHESPRVMTWPLVILAFCTIAFSIVVTPAWPWLHDYLRGQTAEFALGHLIQPALFVSLVLVGIGVAAGVLIYRKAATHDPLAQASPALFRFLENRMWIDELYAHTIIAGSRNAARISDWLDRYFWDGLVRLVAGGGQFLGVLTRGLDERGINAGVDESTAGARGLGRLFSRAHSGQVQTYLGALGLGMLALLILYAWLG
ncbi:MAG: NADH-quinone oxidoreductase subunit L, partial [Verrucomicrobiota bacterium]|nr:NADH-quinone oxidoreductase subunit L [Verrucomicrobiota bacterium]